jgi:DHA1 family bicyclomycin/chloramphenicol resistance-like MFS transporter
MLGLLSAIGPFSIDMYLPAFPDIAKGLNTSVAHVMLSLSSFFLGISIGQLIYGPLLERYGRKRPLMIGLSIYLIASLACALSPSVDMLVAMRFFQALGGCAGMVAARAVIRDVFEGKEIARVFSAIMLVVAVSPMIAPTLGGYLSSLVGWRYVFGALFLLDLFILTLVVLTLKETRAPNPSFSLKPPDIAKSFWSVLWHPQFLAFALTGAVANAGIYAYITGSPQVFMEIHGVSAQTYGWIFAALAAGLIGATQVNNLVLAKYEQERIILSACTVQTISAITLAVLALMQVDSLVAILALVFVFLCCQGFIFPNASSLSIAPFGHNAGTASALMGALQMGVGALVSSAVSNFQDHTARPMCVAMMLTAVSGLTINLLGRRRLTRLAKMETVLEEEVELVNTL